MDLILTSEEEKFRDEVREFVAENITEDIRKKINQVLIKNKRTNGERAIKNFQLENIAYKVIDVYKNTLKHYT